MVIAFKTIDVVTFQSVPTGAFQSGCIVLRRRMILYLSKNQLKTELRTTLGSQLGVWHCESCEPKVSIWCCSTIYSGLSGGQQIISQITKWKISKCSLTVYYVKKFISFMEYGPYSTIPIIELKILQLSQWRSRISAGDVKGNNSHNVMFFQLG